MTDHTVQIQRIRQKLAQARISDPEFRVFGASGHKYQLGKPATEAEIMSIEQQFGIQFPACYRAFIGQIGNGGGGYQNSAAGPFYGIYPLGKGVDEVVYGTGYRFLQQPCILYPKMTDEFWEAEMHAIEAEEEVPDEAYDQEMARIYAGILPIGSQGCTYLQGIVVNGPYRGRVVNVDMDRNKPRFTFEKHFLDWYERWLEEVIAGELSTSGPKWFGYQKGGTEWALLKEFVETEEVEDQRDCLSGLLVKPSLQAETLAEIEALIPGHPAHQSALVHLLCKSDYARATPYLKELISTDLLSVAQFLFWYAKDKAARWFPLLEANMSKISEASTLRFCAYLFRETQFTFGHLILPFTKDGTEAIRKEAFEALGRLPEKEEYLDTLIEGLRDASETVNHTTINALAGIQDDRLLVHYKALARKIPSDRTHLLLDLDRRLKAFGLTRERLLNG